MAFSRDTDRALHTRALTAQIDGRVPGLVAAVARRGEIEWSTGIGTIALPTRATPSVHTRYPIASNSKTFTAVAIMALRDEGRLRLDDTVEAHLPGRTDAVTIRQLLAHTSGMQREPVGDIFDTLVMPERADIVSGWAAADRVGRPHDRWHYSNLGYAVLGEIIARLDGGTWLESIRQRILDPLGMTVTDTTPAGEMAAGYFVPPFSDVPVPEPVLQAAGMDPAGGLISSAADLARWGGFVANPAPEVLSADTLEEMCQPQVMADPRGWTLAYGLGFQLLRHQGRTWVGHTGGWPGSVTGLFTERESATSAIILMNASTPVPPSSAAVDLGTIAIDREPVSPPQWQPGTTVPADLAPLLGIWYSEGTRFEFSVREGRLEARAAGQPADAPPAVFERADGPERGEGSGPGEQPEGTQRYRTVSGRERGEMLVVHRDSAGAVSHLNWATYRVTREPLAFGEWLDQTP